MPVCYCTRICNFAESELNISMICRGGADEEKTFRRRNSRCRVKKINVR